MNGFDEFEEILNSLSTSTILSLFPRNRWSWKTRLNRDVLLQDILRSDTKTKSVIKDFYEKNTSSRKHSQEDRFEEAKRKRFRKSHDTGDGDQFPQVKTDEECWKRIGLFRQHTSNFYTEQVICVVCAGRCFKFSSHYMSLTDIPNASNLRPHSYRAEYFIFDGMLLHKTGVIRTNGDDYGYICSTCLESLKKDRRPKYSLANEMWIGDIPSELSRLTIPERMLISVYFPSAYVIKLYPKISGSSKWKDIEFQDALRGNVATYRLNLSAVCDMVKGSLFPRPIELLSSILSVAIVGPRGEPDKYLRNAFHVRRRCVYDALAWLKENNPFYGNVEINMNTLGHLPEDGIPESILSNIRFLSDDTGVEGHKFSEESEVVVDSMYEDLEGDIHFEDFAVVDVEGSTVKESELLMAAFSNASGVGSNAEPFKIFRDSKFINEYPRYNEHGELFSGTIEDPNIFLGAFPYLFPYGCGGFEVKRDVKVTFQEHAEWALRYEDNRFNRNISFLSQVFGIIQKREVCKAAELQMTRSMFRRNENWLKSLKREDFQKAIQEELIGKPFSNVNIKSLVSLVKATRKSVPGTDESRIALRSKIYGLMLMKNPAFLWMTLNLDLNADPLVQIFAGNPVDMDSLFPLFDAEDSRRRTNFAVVNPFGASTTFHHSIMLILEDILGFKTSTNGYPKREEGIFGLVDGYVGVVEAQGRGMLHLHLLVWLVGAPTNSEMLEKLQDVTFRKRVELFISRHIKSHVEMEGYAEEINEPKFNTFCKEQASAFSRPLDFGVADFHSLRKKKEFYYAWAHQRHSCHPLRCLQKSRKGKVVCKRGAPWELSPNDIVYANGEWKSKRQDSRFNCWNPYISFVTRSNNDIKLLLNGASTRHITFYVTKYAAKRQRRSYNASTLLASRFAYAKQSQYDQDIRKANKRLLSQCVNTLSREQELSGQQIVSYIMRYGDRYLSHKYVYIHWFSMVKFLEQNFWEFQREVSENNVTDNNGNDSELLLEDFFVRLQISQNGTTIKSQINDYIFRGNSLASFSFLDFLLESYERNFDSSEPSQRRNERVPYIGNHDAYKDRCRILRRPDAEMMPDFGGSWIPRNDRSDNHDFYCASILALLKPWRDIRSLKNSSRTWREEFESFVKETTNRNRRIIENFQFYYSTWDDAEQERLRERTDQTALLGEDSNLADLEEDETDPVSADDILADFMENTKSRSELYKEKESAYIEEVTRVFEHIIPAKTSTMSLPVFHWASPDMCQRLEGWKKNIAEFTMDGERLDVLSQNLLIFSNDSYSRIDSNCVDNANAEIASLMETLNPKQRLICSIVDEQLCATLANRVNAEPLRLLVTGSGGVGKSVVIQAIRRVFALRQATEKIAVTATSGIAASHIGGFTLHWWAGIPIRSFSKDGLQLKASTKIKERRTRNIIGKQFLIIDEISMLNLETLAILSRIVSETVEDRVDDRCITFGGLNVIMFGDFHQFPPPLKSHLSLYKTPPPENVWANIGFNIFQEFESVVILTEQMRVIDSTWNDILRHIRSGPLANEDMKCLNDLVLDEENIPDFSNGPWNETTLVTPRNSVREAWNKCSIRDFCIRNNKIRYLCPSQDRFGRNHVDDTSIDPALVATISADDLQSKKILPSIVELAEGIPAIITWNVSVSANLANGSMGTIEKIYLDDRESPTLTNDGEVTLKYPPKIILFKPLKAALPQLDGLPYGVIPVVMSESNFRIQTGANKPISVKRQQYPIEPAFAITDYRSQSQTLKPLIVDLGKPPTGSISRFNAYVALSRGVSREFIRLLRPFDATIFAKPVDSDILRMKYILEELERKTLDKFSRLK